MKNILFLLVFLPTLAFSQVSSWRTTPPQPSQTQTRVETPRVQQNIPQQNENVSKWRKLPYISISQKIKGSVKVATNYVNDFEVTALSMATKKGCNGVICGHIHEPADRMINGYRYLNSGDWIENMSAICIDNIGKIYLYESKHL